MEDWAAHRLATKWRLLKNKIKEWAKTNFGDVRIQKSNILPEIQALDNEERDQLSERKFVRRFSTVQVIRLQVHMDFRWPSFSVSG